MEVFRLYWTEDKIYLLQIEMKETDESVEGYLNLH